MKNVITVIIAVTILLSGCAKVVDHAVEETNLNMVLDLNNKMIEEEDLNLLTKLYSNADDIVIIGTDATERVTEFEGFYTMMEQQFDQSETTKISVNDRTIKIHDSGKVAWYSENIDWDMVVGGQELKFNGIRGTGVLEKRDGQWVFVQVHYSIPAEG